MWLVVNHDCVPCDFSELMDLVANVRPSSTLFCSSTMNDNVSDALLCHWILSEDDVGGSPCWPSVDMHEWDTDFCFMVLRFGGCLLLQHSFTILTDTQEEPGLPSPQLLCIHAAGVLWHCVVSVLCCCQPSLDKKTESILYWHSLLKSGGGSAFALELVLSSDQFSHNKAHPAVGVEGTWKPYIRSFFYWRWKSPSPCTPCWWPTCPWTWRVSTKWSHLPKLHRRNTDRWPPGWG